jgi:hypothetical protein
LWRDKLSDFIPVLARSVVVSSSVNVEGSIFLLFGSFVGVEGLSLLDIKVLSGSLSELGSEIQLLLGLELSLEGLHLSSLSIRLLGESSAVFSLEVTDDSISLLDSILLVRVSLHDGILSIFQGLLGNGNSVNGSSVPSLSLDHDTLSSIDSSQGSLLCFDGLGQHFFLGLDNSPFFPVSFDFFCTVLEFMLV